MALLRELEAMTVEYSKERGATVIETGLAGGDVFLSVNQMGNACGVSISAEKTKALCKRLMWLSERAEAEANTCNGKPMCGKEQCPACNPIEHVDQP